jgi:hypothetical protein
LEAAEAVGEGTDDDDDFCDALCEPGDAANADVVEERLLRVWSMFRSDWTTEAFSNLSRIEIVLTTSSKDWGSARMMAITASSS